METETEQVMMHQVKFRNGNSVAISELVNNEAVHIKFSHNAGMAIVTTNLTVSEEGARELGKLLVKYHNTNEENEKGILLTDLKQRLKLAENYVEELKKENEKLRCQIRPKKLEKKAKSA